MHQPRILAVVVTFFPNPEFLLPLLARLGEQCTEVLVVDNTPSERDAVFQQIREGTDDADFPRIIRLGKNIGIAAALNIGLKVALAEGFDYALLSDQDSLPDSDMVSGLLRAGEELSAQGHRVALVGPVVRDLITEQEYTFQTRIPGRFFYGHALPTSGNPNVSAYTLITSGSLLPMQALRDVGLMNEALFIDYVDTEWCLRAISRGYDIYGTGHAILNHRMGDDYFPVWYFGWRKMSKYSPLRLYYRFRNFVYLLKLPYIPSGWKLRASWYWLGNLYAYTIFSNPRLHIIRAIFHGIRDGLTGRLGPCRSF